MNTRDETRQALMAGDMILVTIGENGRQILCKFSDGVVYVLLFSSGPPADDHISDATSAVPFVRALDLPTTDYMLHPRLIVLNCFGRWCEVNSDVFSGSSLISWADQEDIRHARNVFGSVLLNKSGKDFFLIGRLVPI